MSDTLAAAASNVAPASWAAPAALQVRALVAETIVLVNPPKNYARFLLRALLPIVVHAVDRARRRLLGRLRVPPPQHARLARLRQRRPDRRVHEQLGPLFTDSSSSC